MIIRTYLLRIRMPALSSQYPATLQRKVHGLRAVEPKIETSMVTVWVGNDKFTRVLNEEVWFAG